ncbi:hypothetical protein DMUE_0111 [Dictyocoela muelleri]|nr:hypothetical protein DMUE_0111 [Dictyocoela muelleri]
MLESIRDMVKRDRKLVIGFQPEVVADILDFLKIDSSGNEFLRYDSGMHDDSRFIIFMHTEKERNLKNAENLILDGTFKITTRPFVQCLVIHALLLEKSWTFCYVLMITKSQRDYERVLNKIREITNIAPKHVGVDFAKGLANAVVLCLNAKISYCYFYFGQSIWRKIQQIGLSGNYLQDENIIIDVKKIILLAFLPPTVIALEYCKLKAHMINNYEYSS